MPKINDSCIPKFEYRHFIPYPSHVTWQQIQDGISPLRTCANMHVQENAYLYTPKISYHICIRIMAVTLVILSLTIGMFIWGRVRSDIVALCALAALLLCGILTPAEALAGFSSPIVIMMAGLFVVGGAVLQTGLARSIGQRLMRLSHGNETLAFLLLMLVTSVTGAFVSNTGTVALMMPIVISMAAQAGFQSSRLLMPLAFAGSLGGMLTLIGTPPNLVIDETLREAGYPGLEFFSFLPVGVVCIVVGTLVLLPLSKYFLTRDGGSETTATTTPKKRRSKARMKSPADLAREYDIARRIRRYQVEAGSSAIGQKVSMLKLQETYGVSIVEIRNERMSHLSLLKDVRQNLALSDSVFQEGDILYVTGSAQEMDHMEQDLRLRRQQDNALHFYDLGLVELIVTPESKVNGMKIREAQLRQKHKINVLAMRNGTSYRTDHLAEARLQTGDVLLVQGKWHDILRLNEDNDNWVVLGRPDQALGRVTLDYKAPLAAAIMLVMVAMMVLDAIPVAPVTAVILAGLLTVITGCHRSVETAYKTINWESLVLIAAMMPMSTALEKTGVSETVSSALVSSLGSMGPTALLAGVYLTTSVLTMFISNTATAVLMAPIALVAARESGVSPHAFLFAVTLGASMCFASPFSTPPNALVMKAGNYTFADYLKVGLPLQVVIGIVMLFLLPLLFPF